LLKVFLKNDKIFYENIKAKGTKPSKRAGSVMSGYKNLIFIHGGFDGNIDTNDFFEFNLDNLTWRNLNCFNIEIPRRSLHTMNIVGSKNPKLIFFGGLNVIDGKDIFNNDIFQINLFIDQFKEMLLKSKFYIDIIFD
jgi:hypothetical protein